jgi:short-subunit dehydrogenase
VTALRDKAAALGLENLIVTKLNVLDKGEVARAAKLDFDVLVNNAAIGEGGPMAEIPITLVRQNFEVNLLAPLDLTQRVVRRWVEDKVKGKIVFISSINAYLSPSNLGSYSATKHALQAIAEAMRDELKPFDIQVQTINPGPYFTGFNERMVEAAYGWLDDDVNFTSRATYKAQTDALIDKQEMRLNPNDMIAKFVELIPQSTGPFRTIFPSYTTEWVAAAEEATRERTI